MVRKSTVQTASVIGAGTAGLMAAERLATAGVAVTVHDRMPSVGRKFLLAGRGGLNLTHSEAAEAFLGRYGTAGGRLEAMLQAFPPSALVAWAEALGQATFVGSSGRIFPKAMKASPLLRAWLGRLNVQGVKFELGHRWTGWTSAGDLAFEGKTVPRPDLTVLALGGASWPRLGSDGAWSSILAAQGVPQSPLRPANSGFLVAWSEVFRERFAGEPVKGIALTIGSRRLTGEAMITRSGIEGGGVYALSGLLRDAIDRKGEAHLYIDLRPGVTADAITGRIARTPAHQSVSGRLRKALNLAPVAVGLMREATGGGLPTVPADLARLVKGVRLVLTGTTPIERAISTAGGVAWDAVDENLRLKVIPDVAVAGEMLDWEAPTGGYLLQACFATGAWAADQALNSWPSSRAPGRP